MSTTPAVIHLPAGPVPVEVEIHDWDYSRHFRVRGTVQWKGDDTDSAVEIHEVEDAAGYVVRGHSWLTTEEHAEALDAMRIEFLRRYDNAAHG